MDLRRIEEAVRTILEAVGEDPSREGLRETPQRVARMYAEIFAGVGQDAGELLKVFYEEKHDEIVLVKDIPLYSMCEHHLLPFYGVAHVAYIPAENRITGISKIARVVDTLARRPQLQERLTSQIAETLVERLRPQGVMVVIEAEHLCMMMRGIRKPGSKVTTSVVRGIFRENQRTREEALALMGLGRR